MSLDDLSPELRSALEQSLEADRLLGMKFIPVPSELLVQGVTARADDAPSASGSRSGSVPGARAPSADQPRRAIAERRAATTQSGHAAPAVRPGSTGVRSEGGTAPTVPTPVADGSQAQGADAESAGPSDRDQQLRVIDDQVRGCAKCELHRGRTRTVFGQGNSTARLVFVGEGPGFEEDKQGLAFVGKAGQLLTKMIEAMGLTRDEVYICNTVKCRPPNNRTPTADEILACNPYLTQQLEIIQPEMIVALGAPAAKTLLNTAESISRLRGRFHEYYYSGISGSGPSVPVMPTFHPAYLLRSPDEKRKAWEDLQLVMQRLGLRRPTG